MNVSGVLLLIVGAALALPQVFTPVPAQGLFAAGVLAAIFGGILICDEGQ